MHTIERWQRIVEDFSIQRAHWKRYVREAASVLVIIICSIAASVRRFQQMQKIARAHCLGIVPLVFWIVSSLVLLEKMYLTHDIIGMDAQKLCTNHDPFL